MLLNAGVYQTFLRIKEPNLTTTLPSDSQVFPSAVDIYLDKDYLLRAEKSSTLPLKCIVAPDSIFQPDLAGETDIKAISITIFVHGKQLRFYSSFVYLLLHHLHGHISRYSFVIEGLILSLFTILGNLSSNDLVENWNYNFYCCHYFCCNFDRSFFSHENCIPSNFVFQILLAESYVYLYCLFHVLFLNNHHDLLYLDLDLFDRRQQNLLKSMKKFCQY